jgi:hypothetical protein
MASLAFSKKQWTFAPQAVNNCLLWLDAADTSSYTPSAAITTWRNKGYAGGSATTTSGTVGSTTAEINGLPAFSFAANAYMTMSSMTFAQTTRTVFVVANLGASGTLRRHIYGSVAADSFLVTSGAGTDLEFGYSGNNSYITASPYPIYNTTSIICGTTLSTNGGLFVNGLAQTPYTTNAPGTFGTGATTTQTIGSSTTGTFVLGEAMIFDGAITDIQRQQVEGYLAQKWGLQSFLPSTHPYFTLNNLITYAFKPTQIPTCALWLDASDATSITGTSVYQWLDKSGNANHATAVTGNPTLTQNALNGKSVLTFGGATNLNSPLSMPTTGALTYFCVARPAAGGFISVSAINGGGGNNRPNTLMMYESSTGYWWFSGGVGGYDGNTVTLATSTSRYDINANYWSPSFTQVNINGVSYASSTSAPASLTAGGTFLVGRASGPATEYWNGTIAEIIVYNSTLTTTQRQAVESYLGTKWGIPVAGQGSVAPVANPLAISGCQLWLDAADQTTIVPIVSTWRDNSGLGNNMSLSAGTVTYVTQPGPPCVNFASGGILQTSNYISLTTTTYVFIVAQATSVPVSGFGYVFDFVDILSSDFSIRYTGATTIYNGNSGDIGYLTGYYVNGVLSAYVASGTTTVPTGYNLIDTVNTSQSGSTRMSLSSSFSSSSRCFIGNIREVIVYTGPLTTTQRLQVENYLMAKWGAGRNFWIDASDSTTITAGTTVTKWLDKSGNGNTATTLGSTITYSTAGLYFGGASYMTIPGIAGTLTNNPFVVFVVETFTGNFAAKAWFFGDDANTTVTDSTLTLGYRQGTGAANGHNGAYSMSFWADDLDDLNFTQLSPTGVTRLWTNYLPTSSNRNIRYNGAVDATHINYTRLNAFATPVLGRANGGFYYTGTISEIIVYNQDIGLTNIQRVETYLANKWGKTVPTPVTGLTNPASIAGCVLWLDAADLTSIVTTVSQINDKSGNGYNVTQSSATYQPALTNNYLTLGTSLNSYMNIPQAAINNTSSWTLFLVFNPSSSTNWIMAKQYDAVPNSYNMLSMTNYTSTGGANTTGTTGVLYFRPYNAGTLFTGPAALTTSTNQLLTLICNGTNIYYYINGVLAAITNGTFTIQSQTGATNFTLGAWISSGSLVNSGVTNFQLGEMSFYNSALTTIQIQQIEASLMNKWSITNTVQTANGSLIDTPFLPTDITGCAVWYDGADTSSMTMTGAAITTWADKSGNARNATGATNKPQYAISTGGVSFTAASSQYFTMSVPYSKTNTIFLVSTPVPSNTANMYYFNTTASITGSVYIGGNTGQNTYLTYGIAATKSTFSTGVPTNPFLIYSVKTTGVSTIGYYNGTQVFTQADSSSADTATSWSSLGSAGVGNYLTGTIYEFIIYSVALTNPQIQSVVNYLKNKWNVASSVITVPTPVYNRPFQPVDIAGCQLWLDSADNTALVLSGANVTTWYDKSGNGNNGTATGTPVLTANSINGYQSIYLADAPYFLGSVSITTSTLTCFAVATTNVTLPNTRTGLRDQRLVSLENLTNVDYGRTDGTIALFNQQGTSTIATYRVTGPLANNAITTSTPFMAVSQYNGANAFLWYTGTAGTSTGGASTGNFGITKYGIGNQANPTSETWYGYIGEVIIYNNALSTSQRQQVEAYLAWKWGFVNGTPSLPSTHPGKTLPSFSTVFNPKSISGISLWLDAYDITTLFTNTTLTTPVTASGQVVRGWADKSGNGLNNTTTDTVITYNTTTLGYPAISFPGTQAAGFACALSMGNAGVSDATYFLVVRSTIAGTGGVYLYHAGTKIRQIYANNNLTYMDYNAIAGINGSINVTNLTNVVTRQDTASTGFLAGWDTGNSFGSVTLSGAANSNQTSLTLGQAFTGYFCEVIVYNSVLSTAQRQQVEGYLAWKWGAASLLPTSHSYKKNAP